MAPIFVTALAAPGATSLRDHPTEITPLTPREVLRRAQSVQVRPTARSETPTQSLLYDPDAKIRPVNARRGPSLQICTTISAKNKRTSSNNAAEERQKKLRAAKIAAFSEFEEDLLDRAVYELDILGDASLMEQLFGMTFREISEKGLKTTVFEGPMTSFEARYTNIIKMDMAIARLQNRHLRIECHASRIKQGRIPLPPKPSKSYFPELPARKMIAEKPAQEAEVENKEHRRLHEERRRLDREALRQPPPGVSNGKYSI
ncbi:MAG: hypothetical protein LQ347_002436 [Umbilicaria vellea]|nr:MAG: hypothetical protein LQ347_002436 [Umbilicaria vellea]